MNTEEALATVGLSAVGGRGDGMSEVGPFTLSFSGMKRMDTTVVRVGTTGMHFMDKLRLKMAFLIA